MKQKGKNTLRFKNFMNIWIWISVGIIAIFIFIIWIVSSLKEDSDDGSFVGSAIDTFKNCCKKLFGN